MVQHSTSTEAAPRSRLPAKLANRRMGGVIDRERLFAWLDAQGERPLLWITGPAGAGKTTLVSTWLARTHTPGVWYRVDADDGDPATVFSYLALAARAHSRKRKLQLPALTPEVLLDVPGFASRFFGQFFAALPARCVLVLDALEAAPGPALETLLPWALQELLPGQRVIVTSREGPPPALVHLHARGELATLTWDDLRLSNDEARLIAAGSSSATSVSGTTEDEAGRLHALCDGWAAGYVLLLNVRRRGAIPGPLTLRPGETLQEQLFPYYLNELFERADPAAQQLLMQTALLPAFSAADAAALAPSGDASSLLQALYRRHFFIERSADVPPLYRYHALFREFLLRQGEERLGAARCRQLQGQAAGLLQANGRTEEALQLWIQAQSWDDAVPLILALAQPWLVQGRYATLAQAIDGLPQSLAASNPWLSYWRGVAMLPMSPPQARWSLEVAFNAFERAGDRIGCLMACSTILESFMLQWGDLIPVDSWGDALRDLLAQEGDIPLEVEVRALTSTVVLMMRGAHLHGDLVYRAHRRSLALLPQLADPGLRLVLATYCMLAMILLGEWSAGLRLAAEVEAQLKLDEVPPLQRITFMAMASAHSLWSGHFFDVVAAADQFSALTRAWNIRVFDIQYGGNVVTAHLHLGDVEAAASVLQNLTAERGRQLDEADLDHLAGLISLLRGQLRLARERLDQAILKSTICGSEMLAAMIRLVLAQVLELLADTRGALQQLQAVADFAAASRQRLLEQPALTLRAWVLGRHGDAAAADLLRVALAMGREQGYRLIFPFVPDAVMQEIGLMALRAGIEVDYMCELLRVRRVPPPSPGADVDAHWPWPIRVSLLGPFTLLLDDAPIRLAAKAPKKPLELLKLLAAFGVDSLPLATIEQHLWPDLDGAAARNACNVALHRLRKLLGDEQALQLNEGRLSLNPQRVWTDVASFVRQSGSDAADPERLLKTYRAHLLPDLESPWVLAARERLRSRFLRAMAPPLEGLERDGAFEAAVTLHRRVIEVDPAAEAFHLGLVRCLLALGRRAEALDACDRCSEQLYRERGLRPSAPLLALRRRIETA
jgi:LuxR family maltose regulon positive regulatory protein